MNKSIKILVAYHNKAQLFKNDIVVPIHAGRAVAKVKSKDGTISDQDFKWLMDNMIGDDTGENISELNRDLNEWTVLYWAWKNYDKLGNPDYIGLCHYRRFFELPIFKRKLFADFLNKHGYSQENFNAIFEKYDFIYGHPNPPNPHISFDGWQKAVQLSSKYHPLLYKEYLNFQTENKFYCNNMFIMKKEDFFKMCEECFPVAFDFIKKDKKSTMKLVYPNPMPYVQKLMDENGGWYPRSTSFMMEYISGFYFMYLRHRTRSLMLYKKQFVQQPFYKKVLSLENEVIQGKKHKVLRILGFEIVFKKN